MRHAMPRKQTMAKKIRELEMELAYRKASEPDAKIRELESWWNQAKQRIAELEAELASQRMVFESVRVHDEEMRTSYLQARARAEKAEKELEKVNGLASGWNAAMRQAEARAEKAEQTAEGMEAVVASHVQARREAEARVAELEEEKELRHRAMARDGPRFA